jgi:hypothetical protein
MKKMIIYLLLFLSFTSVADTSSCDGDPLEDAELDLLNISTVRDEDIITQDDVQFCGDQKIKNANLSPEILPDNGTVWRVGNRRWNDDWEKKYQDWVKENLSLSIFEDINLPTDCADAAVAVRSIFARIHNLPAAFAGMKFSNFQTQYSQLPTVKNWNPKNWKESYKKDKRFQKAIKDWMSGVGTVNLHQDTYQVRVLNQNTRELSECLAPGTVYLSEGHTEIISFAKDSVFPFRLSSSTVPSKVRPLSENILNTLYFEFDPITDHMASSRGFLWWNWVVNCKGKMVKVNDEKMPYYSKEQKEFIKSKRSFYSHEDSSFNLNYLYQKSLNLSPEELQIRLQLEARNLLNTIERDIFTREQIIENAAIACQSLGITGAKDCFMNNEKEGIRISDDGRILYGDMNFDEDIGVGDCSFPYNQVYCEDFLDLPLPAKSENHRSFYYEHSTPNRDERLKNKINNLYSIISNLENSDDLKMEMLNKYIDVDNGKKISYYHFLRISTFGTFSPQPWDIKDKRWGAYWMDYLKCEFETDNSNTIAEYENLKKANDKAKLEEFKKDQMVFVREYEAFQEFSSSK